MIRKKKRLIFFWLPLFFFTLSLFFCFSCSCKVAGERSREEGQKNRKKSVNTYALAEELYSAGEKEAARNILLDEVKRGGPEPQALRLLAALALEEGNMHEALAWLDRGDSLAADLALLYLDKARLLWYMRGDGEALSLCALARGLLDSLSAKSPSEEGFLDSLKTFAFQIEESLSEAFND